MIYGRKQTLNYPNALNNAATDRLERINIVCPCQYLER
jgi:hypothetical protein